MLRKICEYSLRNHHAIKRYSSQVSTTTLNKNIKATNINSVTNTNRPKKGEDDSLSNVIKSVLQPLDEDISHVSSYLKPTFNIAAYVNKSETLQELVKLGVNLHEIEKNVEMIEYMLGLKFEDIKDHILFLSNLNLTTEDIGYVITKNPMLFKEDLENLKIRINYLEFKKFSKETITHIISSNPLWLTLSTQEIDETLGYLQNNFQLDGNEVRLVAAKCPRLVTTGVNKIKVKTFVLKEEMGFNDEELKKILLKQPTLFTKGQDRILKTFEYLHREMNIPLERIVEEPQILKCRQKRLMERHSFLKKLGRDQYNPKMPNYVSLTSLVSGSDSIFCVEIAKSSVQAYNAFLKSL